MEISGHSPEHQGVTGQKLTVHRRLDQSSALHRGPRPHPRPASVGRLVQGLRARRQPGPHDDGRDRRRKLDARARPQRRPGHHSVSLRVPINPARCGRPCVRARRNACGSVVRGVPQICFAGHGRSATLALVTLRILGWPLDDAVEHLSRARGFPVPETPEQLRWVATLPRALLRPRSSGRVR